MSTSSIKVPPVPSHVNWRPKDSTSALNVYELGGPLVDHATGRVILLGQLSDGLWTQLVPLPAGASPMVVPDNPQPHRRLGFTPRAPRGRRHKGWWHMLDDALTLAAAGYRVFPIKPCEKRPPLIRKWPQLATTDPGQIQAWWSRWPNANIAAATGDGLAVVDVDPRSGGTLNAVSNLGLTTFTRGTTTPGGGWQLQYRVRRPVTSRSGALAPGVDVKAEGGYVLLPPSVRADGKYLWTPTNWQQIDLARVDADLLNQVRTTSSGLALWRAGSASEGKRPEDVREGQRHDQLVRWAARFAHAYEPAEVESLIEQFNARLSAPLPDDEVQAILHWIARKQAVAA